MAKRVDFLETTDDGQNVVATVAIQNGQLILVSGDRRMADATEMVDLIQRIPGYEKVSPLDGDRFLAALCLAYSGSMIRASKPYGPPAD